MCGCCSAKAQLQIVGLYDDISWTVPVPKFIPSHCMSYLCYKVYRTELYCKSKSQHHHTGWLFRRLLKAVKKQCATSSPLVLTPPTWPLNHVITVCIVNHSIATFRLLGRFWCGVLSPEHDTISFPQLTKLGGKISPMTGFCTNCANCGQREFGSSLFQKIVTGAQVWVDSRGHWANIK